MFKEWYQHTHNVVESNDIPGLSAGISQNGVTLICEGFGWRDREEHLPVTAHTTFRLASITKTFTALAVMMLQESGKLSIEDPVLHWLPELKLPAEEPGEIVIRHLLNHTSGLPDLTLYYRMMVESLRQDSGYRKSERLPFHPARVQPVSTMEQFISLFNHSVREWYGPPGINYSYSNEGYMFLDEIIRRASGQSYTDFITSRIIYPLAMSDTSFTTSPQPTASELTKIYYITPKRKRSLPWRSHQETKAAGSWIHSGPVYGHGHLMSSATDMLRFAELFYNEGKSQGTALVRKDSIQAMIDGRLGLSVQKWKNGMTLVGHAGGQKGISSDLYIAVEAKIAAIALANRARAPVWDITLGGINAGLGEPLSNLPLPGTDNNLEPLREGLIGNYISDRWGRLRIDRNGGQLFGKLHGMKGLVIPKLSITISQPDQIVLGRFPAKLLLNGQGNVFGFALGPGHFFKKITSSS